MKNAFACVIAVSAMVVSAVAADVTAKISDVHLCCKSCVKIAQSTVTNIPGVTAVADEENDLITLTGPDIASVQKGADELTSVGFFGKSDNGDIKIDGSTGAKGVKVQTLNITDVHLCCGKCIKAVNSILSAVPGVVTNTAVIKATSFTVTGDFTDSDVMAALQKNGLTGKIAQ